MEEALPPTSSFLELAISFPGSSSGDGGRRRENLTLDINQVPAEEDEEWITLSSSNYSNTLMKNNEGAYSSPPRKKLRLCKQKSQLLEDSFQLNRSLDTKQKEALAVKLELTPRQVEVWFQNRRARSKLKQTEMECEYLRRWFTSLMEQNQRLHKQVNELRASSMKTVAANILLPNALSMCPRCHLISSSNPPPAANTHQP